MVIAAQEKVFTLGLVRLHGGLVFHTLGATSTDQSNLMALFNSAAVGVSLWLVVKGLALIFNYYGQQMQELVLCSLPNAALSSADQPDGLCGDQC